MANIPCYSVHMYAHEQIGSEQTIVPAMNHLGCTNDYAWDLLDAPQRAGSTVLGRLQGVGIPAGISSESWNFSSDLVFTDQRFEGSTLSVQGRLGPARLRDKGDWAVVGGTGEFAYAQGTVSYKRIHDDHNNGFIIELNICLTIAKPKPVQKVWPWGGTGGTPYEIQEDNQLPKRLKSVKIYDDDNVIKSIAFSYLDQAGQRRTVGRDDGEGGSVIQFGPNETVKEIFGSTGNYGGHTVVTSLAIVNSLDQYVLYGKQPPGPGNTPFREIAPENHSIVGFYWRLGGQVVRQIGVYVRRNRNDD